jgi:hypothetical protein
MDALTIAARALPLSAITADKLVEGARRYMMPDDWDRLSVIPANAALPARIILKGK